MPRTRRIRPADLAADHAALMAIEALRGYTPFNAAFSTARLTELRDAAVAARQEEIRTQNSLRAKRALAKDAEVAFHNAVIGAKTQVVAQFGDDSDVVAAMGMKRRSERRVAARPAKPPSGADS